MDECSVWQEVWIKGYIWVMVFMNVFGMGIDKVDVCSVVYFEFFDSLEVYFQEVGWVGCDGEKVYVVFLYSFLDKECFQYYLE